MANDSRVQLEVGAVIFTNRGRVLVTALQPQGVQVSTTGTKVVYISYADLTVNEPGENGVRATHKALLPWWDGLSENAKREALWKQGIVLELLTGYRSGSAGLAEPGEPFVPFGPDHRGTEYRKREVMAQRLEGEGRAIGLTSLYNWIRAWEAEGLRGLVDGRRTKGISDFSGLDPGFMTAMEQQLASFDGDRSVVSLSELRRRGLADAAEDGLSCVSVPQRLGDRYIAHLRKQMGRSPRAHKSALVRRRAGHRSSQLLHPSHMGMDVTRADNLVLDENLDGRCSVEIITVLSVSTRVVLACRVVPRSATSLEAGLALYDAMRPFSMLVEGTSISDWRWAGLPHSLSLPVQYANQAPGLQGPHWVPGVRPTSLRTDHGAIFTSDHFLGLLRDFGIDFLPSRVGAATDNSFVERWHETLQRALQQIPGYKGRNTQERGRVVAKEPLLMAGQLERHLHRFIALDYHRSWHEGLVLPNLERGRFTPLEYFDVLLEATGRIDVPQHPDLIYQFLPVVWLTPNGAGVEYRNLSYDGAVMQEFRNVPRGKFRRDSSQMPFHYDPRDLSRLWVRHPETDRIHQIRWRGSDSLNIPLNDRMLHRAAQLLYERGGNRALNRHTASRQIIDALGSLSSPRGQGVDTAADWLRWNTAKRDHAEAASAADLLPEPPIQVADPFDHGPWPDYDPPVP